MDQSSKNNYSAADIERYHSGQMPDAEMHALEKAALDDPFLADALEGYSFSVHPSAEIASLKERLREASKDNRTTALFFRNHNWMKAAAILLVVTGAAWLIFRNNATTNQEQAANQEVLAKRSDSSKLSTALSNIAATPDSNATKGSVVMLSPGKTRNPETMAPLLGPYSHVTRPLRARATSHSLAL